MDLPGIEGFEPVIKLLQADLNLQCPEKLKFIALENVACNFQDTHSQQASVSCTDRLEGDSTATSFSPNPESPTLSPQPKFAWCCTHKLFGEFHNIDSLAVSKNGQLLATGHGNGTVNLWNLQQRKHHFCFIGEKKGVLSLAFSPDAKTLVSGGCDRKLSVWDLERRRFQQTFFSSSKRYSHEGFIHAITCTSDGKYLFSGGDDGKIRIWDCKTGRNLRILNGHGKGIFAIALHPSDDYLISGSEDQTIKIWTFQNGQCRRTIKSDAGCIFSLAVHPKGDLFTSACEDGTIKIWDFETGVLQQTLKGHDTAVLSNLISPDGKTLVSACLQEVKLWSLTSGNLIQTLPDANHPVTYSPDGQFLITGSYLEAIRIWEYRAAKIQAEPDFVLDGAWWEILQVRRTASPSEVKIAYHKLASLYHPDVNNSSEAKQWMQAIDAAKKQFKLQNNKRYGPNASNE